MSFTVACCSEYETHSDDETNKSAFTPTFNAVFEVGQNQSTTSEPTAAAAAAAADDDDVANDDHATGNSNELLNLGSKGREFDFQSGCYQVDTARMADCLWTGKPSRYITGVSKLSTSLPGWGKGGARLLDHSVCISPLFL